jgi:hypothetical protein
MSPPTRFVILACCGGRLRAFVLLGLRLLLLAVDRERRLIRLVTRRRALDPTALVAVVSFVGLATFGPPATLVVLHHQLLALCVELLVADGSGLVLLLEFGAAAVGFPKIYLSLFVLHFSSLCFGKDPASIRQVLRSAWLPHPRLVGW